MRRALIAFLTVVVAVPALAQSKVARIGMLSFGYGASSQPVQAFRDGLREAGYIEGKNAIVEFRSAEGQTDRLPVLAAELLKMRLDVLVTEGTPTLLVVKKANTQVPVVAATVLNPVKLGLVSSLNRPGGNITGLTFASGDRTAKQLQLLKEMIPKVDSVAVLYNENRPDSEARLKEVESSIQSLRLKVTWIAVRDPADLDRALDRVASARAAGLVTMGDGMLSANRLRIIEFARKQRLPAVFPEREFTNDGAMASYGPDLAANFRRAAAYVDKILKGVKPGDLPIEQQNKIDFVINVKAANAIGVKISDAVLLRADEVIR